MEQESLFLDLIVAVESDTTVNYALIFDVLLYLKQEKSVCFYTFQYLRRYANSLGS